MATVLYHQEALFARIQEMCECFDLQDVSSNIAEIFMENGKELVHLWQSFKRNDELLRQHAECPGCIEYFHFKYYEFIKYSYDLARGKLCMAQLKTKFRLLDHQIAPKKREGSLSAKIENLMRMQLINFMGFETSLHCYHGSITPGPGFLEVLHVRWSVIQRFHRKINELLVKPDNGYNRIYSKKKAVYITYKELALKVAASSSIQATIPIDTDVVNENATAETEPKPEV